MSHKSHSLGHLPIADHSFSEDRSLLAVARESNVELYYTDGKRFELGNTLTDHDKTVTSVDISSSGRLVTCSQDRNAIVWEPQMDGSWKPTLVLLRISRAATFVRWSPNEHKFAVGTGDRLIAVCYYEADNDWWIAKHIKKPIRSTILSVAWHPNSVLLAAGSTDGHARVFSGFIKNVDERPAPTVWGERLPFQTLCGDFTNSYGGWVHDVAFSPSGNALAFATHDSSIVIAYPQGPDLPPQAVLSVSTSLLPFRSILWSNENQIIAAGHDCHPVVFEGDVSGWKYASSIDDPTKAKTHEARESTALNMFRQLDLKGTVESETGGTELPTIHQNTINTIRIYSGSPENVSQISSTGVDGKIVIYKL